MERRDFDLGLLAARGEDVFVSANVEIRRPELVRVGNHVAIDSGFYCTVTADIGDYVHIGPYVTVIGGASASLSMGHFSNVAAGGRLICAGDELLGEGLVGPAGLIPEKYQDRKLDAPIRLENFASLGTNSVVMPGVTLAEGSVVGACSLVTKDTEPWTIYVGIPARPLRVRPREKMIAMARELGY